MFLFWSKECPSSFPAHFSLASAQAQQSETSSMHDCGDQTYQLGAQGQLAASESSEDPARVFDLCAHPHWTG